MLLYDQISITFEIRGPSGMGHGKAGGRDITAREGLGCLRADVGERPGPYLSLRHNVAPVSSMLQSRVPPSSAHVSSRLWLPGPAIDGKRKS